MPKPIKDRTGQRYGKLVAISMERGISHHMHWLCQCDCGKRIIVSGDNLRTGNTASCGCSRIVHGKSKTAVHHAWRQMFQRCENPKDAAYHNYGARGITIDSRWRDFEIFYADMGDRPDPKMTVERIDNEKGYGPTNCKWATRKEQLNNRRGNLMIEAFGKRQSITRWAEEYAMPTSTIKNHIYRARMTPEEALSMPTQDGYKYLPVRFSDAKTPQGSRWRNRSHE